MELRTCWSRGRSRLGSLRASRPGRPGAFRCRDAVPARWRRSCFRGQRSLCGGSSTSKSHSANLSLGPRFLFLSFRYIFLFFMDTEGSTADLLSGRYRITSNHFCKGQWHFGNSLASVSAANAASFLFASSYGEKQSILASGLVEICVPNCTCPLESLCCWITRSCAAVTGGTMCFLFYSFSGTFHNGKQTTRQQINANKHIATYMLL